MTITITLKGVLLTVLGIAGIVLLIYLIVLAANLIKTLKKTNEILDDAKVISGTAADKVQKLDVMVDSLSESAGTVADALKGNQSIIAAATHVINAATGFVNILKKKEKKNSKKENE